MDCLLQRVLGSAINLLVRACLLLQQKVGLASVLFVFMCVFHPDLQLYGVPVGISIKKWARHYRRSQLLQPAIKYYCGNAEYRKVLWRGRVFCADLEWVSPLKPSNV